MYQRACRAVVFLVLVVSHGDIGNVSEGVQWPRGPVFEDEILARAKPVSAAHGQNADIALMVPASRGVDQEKAGEPAVTNEYDNSLTQAQRRTLEAHGWSARVGGSTAVWVSITEQALRILKGDRIVWQAPCATAANGPGSEMDSCKTPIGWHMVCEKIGAGAAWGQVFRSRKPVNQVWKPANTTEEDLVLTRVLVLDGLEPGKNKGGNVDSNARNIYIHGTNAEDKIGTPSSHGCVRLTNDAVIAAFDRISLRALVLITD